MSKTVRIVRVKTVRYIELIIKVTNNLFLLFCHFFAANIIRGTIYLLAEKTHSVKKIHAYIYFVTVMVLLQFLKFYQLYLYKYKCDFHFFTTSIIASPHVRVDLPTKSQNRIRFRFDPVILRSNPSQPPSQDLTVFKAICLLSVELVDNLQIFCYQRWHVHVKTAYLKAHAHTNVYNRSCLWSAKIL